jgi:hypothetical protein
MIVKVPRRQNQPCPTGEKRGHSGKCRKRWWGEIEIYFVMCLNILNKVLCLLSKWKECWMGGEFGFNAIFSYLPNYWLAYNYVRFEFITGVDCEKYNQNI